MARAEVLIEGHAGHAHAPPHILNHLVLDDLLARIAAVRRDHNFVIRLLLVLRGFDAALVGVIMLPFMTVGALPLAPTLLLHLRRGLLLSCIGRGLMLGSTGIGSDNDYVLLSIGFVGTRFAFLLVGGRRGLLGLLSSSAAG